jgi:hypothetical protein
VLEDAWVEAGALRQLSNEAGIQVSPPGALRKKECGWRKAMTSRMARAMDSDPSAHLISNQLFEQGRTEGSTAPISFPMGAYQ